MDAPTSWVALNRIAGQLCGIPWNSLTIAEDAIAGVLVECGIIAFNPDSEEAEVERTNG